VNLDARGTLLSYGQFGAREPMLTPVSKVKRAIRSGTISA
jgi:hypothetical protein